MANSEHKEKLKLGFVGWNSWRKSNPTIQPDLSFANLDNMHLEFMNLSNSFLTRASLVGADLSGVLFQNSNLRNARLNSSNAFLANFSDADLTEAELLGTNLTETDFTNANLTRTELERANFYGAKLDGCIFESAMMCYTILGGLDLSKCKSLSTVIHFGPSPISMDTVYKSKGQIPETFLRGTGVPQGFIEYVNSLTTKPIEFNSCFISYSNKNQEFADRLHADLQENGVRCWLATEDLKIGDKFRTRIEESIRMHDKLLIVLSETSVVSPWVESEVEAALERERKEKRLVLFPVRLDDAVMDTNVAWAAEIRRTRQIGNFCNWKDHDSYKKVFDQLLDALKADATSKKGI